MGVLVRLSLTSSPFSIHLNICRAYNVVFGLFQAPYYAFSQTMMAELTPPGFDNMFFGLFGLSNRASSMIGPNVIQAIIDDTNNNWKGFPFLFAICLAASVVIWWGVDVHKGRRDAVEWAERNRAFGETGVLVKGDKVAEDGKRRKGLWWPKRAGRTCSED